MLSDKMLVQYKVYSHIVELDQDIYGSDTPDDTAVARLQSCKLLWKDFLCQSMHYKKNN